ncbi:DUF5071 domain-containing protein [Massilia sp. CMS3.1]|uniref:DUF5071 domain-containing protein n=1 Tax=Massilia sp. CMS3.1 TaxID=3373083 RepID=UPI003EE78C80
MGKEIYLLLPRDKHDQTNAIALVSLGWEKVECVVPQILEWVQDLNWPTAFIFVPFLVDAGARLAPFIRPIFAGDDAIWTLNILQAVVSQSPALMTALSCELERLASNPTHNEELEGASEEARQILASHGR